MVPDSLSAKDTWDVIRLDDGDRVVRAVHLPDARAEECDLVLVTSDAQLLRFPASAVRPQGRAAGGMAGIRLADGAQVIAFAAVVPASAVVVTVAGTTQALPGTDSGNVKVTPLAEYPAKGRGTAGVRAHRLRSGQDALLAAWVGPAPARAATASGVPVDLPESDLRRDGSGVALTIPVAGIGSGLSSALDGPA